jgi:succinylglutamate desuccinylase
MLSNENIVLDLLDGFEQMAKEFPSEIPWCIEMGPKDSTFVTAIGSVIHGNETGSLPAVIAMLNELTDQDNPPLKGRYFFFIGNPDAVKAETRYIERDLNRCFHLNDSKTLEGRRAQELALVLSKVNLFIDYHQTNQPAVFPFFTFAFHEESYRWAAYMKAAQHFVTRDPRIAFSSEGLCGDEWVRQRGQSAVTIELGRSGLSHAAHQITLSSLRRVIGYIESELDHGRSPHPPSPEAKDQLNFFEVATKIPWPGDEAALLPGFENFQSVKAGQELGISRPGEKIIAPVDGYLMFPKYPKRNENGRPVEAQGGDIVQIIRPMTQHPRTAYASATQSDNPSASTSRGK